MSQRLCPAGGQGLLIAQTQAPCPPPTSHTPGGTPVSKDPPGTLPASRRGECRALSHDVMLHPRPTPCVRRQCAHFIDQATEAVLPSCLTRPLSNHRATSAGGGHAWPRGGDPGSALSDPGFPSPLCRSPAVRPWASLCCRFPAYKTVPQGNSPHRGLSWE